jgi:hypothetical protein
MSSVSDPQEGNPDSPPDLSSLAVSSPVLGPTDQFVVSSGPEAQQGAGRTRNTVFMNLNADSNPALHRGRGSNQLTAADIIRDVTGAQRSVLASLIQECGGPCVRSLVVERMEMQPGSQPPVDDIREICSQIGGELHAVSRGEAGMVLLTFLDARDCVRAKAALSRALGTAISVREARPKDPEHLVTGARFSSNCLCVTSSSTVRFRRLNSMC